MSGVPIEGPNCRSCNTKKRQAAKSKGLCTLCFVKPQSKLPTEEGKPSEMCEKCLITFSKALRIWDENFKMNRKGFEKTDGGK